ncbi:MAG: ATP phosphoribosyltransferase regulatory subunit, partial [Spartobacteria bacterium]
RAAGSDEGFEIGDGQARRRELGVEFLQFNADILGESSPQADAEIIALAIDLLRAFGFTAEHFVVRLSDRKAWMDFLQSRGCDEAACRTALACADKLEREPEEKLNAKLAPTGLTVADLKAFIAAGSPRPSRRFLKRSPHGGSRDSSNPTYPSCAASPTTPAWSSRFSTGQKISAPSLAVDATTAS